MIIKCENINKNYHTLSVLNNLNLQVQTGEKIAIVGASGCGKSTLLNILGTIDKIDSGAINICGENINTMSEKQLSLFRAKNIGFIYQFHHLLTDFSIIENIMMPLLINNFNKKSATDKALKLLKMINIENKKNYFPQQLSGGQQQKIAILRAIITRPKIILADEPTGNLDDKNAIKSLELLIALQQKYNTTLILVTHDKKIADKMDKTLILKNGILC